MKISEYVSLGHPDKVADYISEYILDRLIEQDPKTRYALEVQIKDNFVTLGGEITTNAKKIKYTRWVKEAIASIGYTHEYAKLWGKGNTLDATKVKVKKHISKQSNDISQGVNNDGWGDQGIMFGMAVKNAKTCYLPEDFFIAKDLCQELYRCAKNTNMWGLDIKTQIVLNNRGYLRKVIVAAPCKEDKLEELHDFVKEYCGRLSCVGEKTPEIIINGTGAYIKHASMGDCGTTGRKLAVDFYGGNCNVGGGSPWTKDGSKADLTLNLYARRLALDYVLEHNIDYAKCGIGCCIGKQEIDITIWDKHNKVLKSYTETMPVSKLIKKYALASPIYARLCRDGLFGWK
jgi:S-adenosylmethionine synthetase